MVELPSHHRHGDGDAVDLYRLVESHPAYQAHNPKIGIGTQKPVCRRRAGAKRAFSSANSNPARPTTLSMIGQFWFLSVSILVESGTQRSNLLVLLRLRSTPLCTEEEGAKGMLPSSSTQPGSTTQLKIHAYRVINQT